MYPYSFFIKFVASEYNSHFLFLINVLRISGICFSRSDRNSIAPAFPHTLSTQRHRQFHAVHVKEWSIPLPSSFRHLERVRLYADNFFQTDRSEKQKEHIHLSSHFFVHTAVSFFAT